MSSNATDSVPSAAPTGKPVSQPSSAVTSPSSNPSAAPSATLVPTHFPHKTTRAAPVHSYLDTATRAINTVPIELDSTPVSPVSGQGAWKSSERVPAIDGAVNKIKAGAAKVLGTGKDGERLKDDRAVMDAPPGTPGPEDFEVVEGKEREVKEGD